MTDILKDHLADVVDNTGKLQQEKLQSLVGGLDSKRDRRAAAKNLENNKQLIETSKTVFQNILSKAFAFAGEKNATHFESEATTDQATRPWRVGKGIVLTDNDIKIDATTGNFTTLSAPAMAYLLQTYAYLYPREVDLTDNDRLSISVDGKFGSKTAEYFNALQSKKFNTLEANDTHESAESSEIVEITVGNKTYKTKKERISNPTEEILYDASGNQIDTQPNKVIPKEKLVGINPNTEEYTNNENQKVNFGVSFIKVGNDFYKLHPNFENKGGVTSSQYRKVEGATEKTTNNVATKGVNSQNTNTTETITLNNTPYTLDRTNLPAGLTLQVEALTNQAHDLKLTLGDKQRLCRYEQALSPQFITHGNKSYNITPIIDRTKRTISFTVEEFDKQEAEKSLAKGRNLLDEQIDAREKSSQELLLNIDEATRKELQPVIEQIRNNAAEFAESIQDKYFRGSPQKVNPGELLQQMNNNTLNEKAFINGNQLTDLGNCVRECTVGMINLFHESTKKVNQVLESHNSDRKYQPYIDASNKLATSLNNLSGYMRTESGFIMVINHVKENPSALQQFIDGTKQNFATAIKEAPINKRVLGMYENMDKSFAESQAKNAIESLANKNNKKTITETRSALKDILNIASLETIDRQSFLVLPSIKNDLTEYPDLVKQQYGIDRYGNAMIKLDDCITALSNKKGSSHITLVTREDFKKKNPEDKLKYLKSLAGLGTENDNTEINKIAQQNLKAALQRMKGKFQGTQSYGEGLKQSGKPISDASQEVANITQNSIKLTNGIYDFSSLNNKKDTDMICFEGGELGYVIGTYENFKEFASKFQNNKTLVKTDESPLAYDGRKALDQASNKVFAEIGITNPPNTIALQGVTINQQGSSYSFKEGSSQRMFSLQIKNGKVLSTTFDGLDNNPLTITKTPGVDNQQFLDNIIRAQQGLEKTSSIAFTDPTKFNQEKSNYTQQALQRSINTTPTTSQ